MDLNEFPQIVVPTESLPPSIALIGGFPKQLYLKGDPEALRGPLVAIVGTRNPSAYGMKSAAYFSRELTRRGWGVVSGLAVGIDATAHRACLRENGVTVGVVAHGLDDIYPSANRPLAMDILDKGGALISEFEPGTPPLRYHFPLRNRIISALSVATLVVEASHRSGSLITARCAADQGREVLVVPGPFHLPGFHGSHSLIRDGARLVRSVEDCLEEISQGSLGMPLHPRQFEPWDQEEEWGSSFQKFGGKATLSDLAEVSERPIGAILQSMKAAEVAGVVERIEPQTWLWLK